MNTRHNILFLALMATVLIGCDDMDRVEFGILPDEAYVSIDADWSKYTDDDVSGMTVFFYDESGSLLKSRSTNSINHTDITLAQAEYTVMAMNQSPSEFAYVDFNNLDNIRESTVSAKQFDGYGWLSKDFIALRQPEALAIGIGGPFAVSEHMVHASHDYPAYCPDPDCFDYNPEFPYNLGTITPVGFISKLDIKVKVKNVSEVAGVRGFITGVASGRKVKTAEVTDYNGQYVLDSWNVTRDSRSDDQGYMLSSADLFGLDIDSSDDTLLLVVQIKLKNGDGIYQAVFRYVDFLTFDEDLSHYYIEAEIDEWLPASKDMSGSFNATVDDWGPIQDINL